MEGDASSVGTYRTPRTQALANNGLPRDYSFFFSVITTCTSLFLVVRSYQGDNLPSKHLPGFFVYTLTLGTCSSLCMWNIVWEHRGYNLPLWKKRCCYVAWFTWLAAAITITVLFKRSYDCFKINKTEPLAFRHCHTLVALQTFLWIVVVLLGIVCVLDPPAAEDPRPPRPSPWSRWMQWRRTRGGLQQEGGGGGGGAAEVADEFRRRNDLEAGGGRGGDGVNGDAARGPARGVDEDNERPNAIEMSTIPGPKEPSINLGAIPGPPDPK